MQLGLFGKVPSHGDFIQRDLPARFVRPWDAWLSQALMASRETLGAGWPDAYLLSAPWCFVIEADILGTTGWGGVLVSSIDRVNRFYPLTIAVALDQEEASIVWAESRATFYHVLEIAALDLIEHARPLDDALADASARAEAALMATPDAAGGRQALASALLKVPRETDQDGRNSGVPRSWWWSDHRDLSLILVSRGLPPAASFAGILDGDWNRHGWTDSPLAELR